MPYIAAHNCIVLYAIDNAPIVDNDDGVTAPVLPAIPANPVVLGYTDLPQTSRGFNNSKGFAVGQQGAAYNKRGNRTPTLNVTIRPGNIAALANLQPDENGVLPSLAIFVVVRDQFTLVFRKCKLSTAEYVLFGTGQENGEVAVTANFMAVAVQEVAAMMVAPALLRALGVPLMWSDTRRWVITDAAGAQLNYRRALMSLSVQVDYGTERKNARPNFGDNEAASMTSYDLLEHHQRVSGTASLHGRLPRELFDGAVRAQDWGDMIITVKDVEASKGFDLTLSGVFPTDESGNGGDSNAEIDYTVPFTADSLNLVPVSG